MPWALPEGVPSFCSAVLLQATATPQPATVLHRRSVRSELEKRPLPKVAPLGIAGERARAPSRNFLSAQAAASHDRLLLRAVSDRTIA